MELSIAETMEDIARRAVYIKMNGLCPECGGMLNENTAQCRTPSRHQPELMEGNDE